MHPRLCIGSIFQVSAKCTTVIQKNIDCSVWDAVLTSFLALENVLFHFSFFSFFLQQLVGVLIEIYSLGVCCVVPIGGLFGA